MLLSIRTLSSSNQTENSVQRRPRKGAAMLEFAAVAPVFFMLVFGIIELGRGLMVISLLNHAARISCRKAITGQLTSTSAVQSDVDTTLGTLKIPAEFATKNVYVNDSTATALSSTTASGTEVTVQILVPIEKISWVPVPKFLSGNLQGIYTSRIE